MEIEYKWINMKSMEADNFLPDKAWRIVIIIYDGKPPVLSRRVDGREGVLLYWKGIVPDFCEGARSRTNPRVSTSSNWTGGNA